MQCWCKLPIWLPACCSLMKISFSTEVYSTCAYSSRGSAFLTNGERSKEKQVFKCNSDIHWWTIIQLYILSILKNEVFSALLVHQNSLSLFISEPESSHTALSYSFIPSLCSTSVKPQLSFVQRVVAVPIQYICVQITKCFLSSVIKKGVKNSYSLRQVIFDWNIHDDRKWHYQLINWSALWIRAI